MTRTKTYSELILLPTFDERYEYLKLTGSVGRHTFGIERYLNQIFYRSREWKRSRDIVIVRDYGCDLAIPELHIRAGVIVHHMNPMTIEDIESGNPDIFDPEFLICTSINTHNGLHFGIRDPDLNRPITRFKNDTSPWRLEQS